MPEWLRHLRRRLSLAQRFSLASLVILVSGMAGIGWWVGRQIERGVINRTAATTALYVDSIVAQHLQELAVGEWLRPGDSAALNTLLQETELGQQIAAFKVWDQEGRILYSTDPELVGEVFPVEEGLLRAWQGQVAAEISNLDDEENVRERERGAQMLEMYSPVRQTGTDKIIAVAEFYYTVDDLQTEVDTAQRRSWLVVGIATLLMYLLLASFVQRASDTIERQQTALSAQVDRLTDLLGQNKELNERVRRAAARTTALNERFLRRISAELHDGPAQELGLAMLRLDNVFARHETTAQQHDLEQADEDDLQVVQHSLRHALREVRAISTGLGVPQLSELTVEATLARVIRAHERRTGTTVSLTQHDLPERASLPVKITLYRLIQEALTNAYRHAGAAGQRVDVRCEDGYLLIEVSDQGPGLSSNIGDNQEQHLGLIGMRERVESLGGDFEAISEPGRGTTIKARLHLQAEEEYER